MASGFDFVSLTVANDDHGSNTALCAIAEERNYFSQNANRFLLVRTVEDVIEAKRTGRLGISFHFQGTVPIEHDLRLVERYYELGVRHMALVYNRRNAVGSGCHDTEDQLEEKAGLDRSAWGHGLDERASGLCFF